MPGIVTHNKIFKDSMKLLFKKDIVSYLSKSIFSLFNSEEFSKAGMFGTIGPNIFDYLPVKNKKGSYGHEVSFFLHNGGSESFIQSMINTILSAEDKNNEWLSMQRAYLYGYISHIVSDSIINPFVFYWSGFPDLYTKEKVNFFREQNFLFKYNIDNYYLYYDDNKEGLEFNIDEMLPVEKKFRFLKLDPAVKDIILESIHDTSPELYKKIIWYGDKKNKGNNDNHTKTRGYIDILPNCIKWADRLRRTNNQKLINVMDEIKVRNIFYSDYIVRYPVPRKTNLDFPNLHRRRWQNPAGPPGFRYDSIEDLVKLSCQKTVGIWMMIEEGLYNNRPVNFKGIFNFNAYTGNSNAGYHDMTLKDPIRIY